MSKTSKSKGNTFKTIRLYLEHVRRYPGYAIGLLLSVPATVLLLDFMKPYILSTVLDQISSGSYNPNNLWDSFGTSIILFILATMFSDILGWRLNIWMIWKLEMRVMRDMANHIYAHLISMGAYFHANRFSGSLVSQTGKFMGSYIRFADTTIFNLYTLICATIFTIIILLPRAPLYVGAVLILMALYILGSVYLAKRIQPANTAEAQMESKQTGYLADSLANVMAIKGFAQEAYERERFYHATTDTFWAVHRVMRVTQMRDLFASIITGGLGIVALLIAVFGVVIFKADVGTVFLMVSYTGALAHRLWEFNSVLRNYNRAFGDSYDMTEILQLKPEVKDPKKPEEPRIEKGAISFENVSFTHADARKGDVLFRNLNLTIRAGEKIGLVGRSGSGKTTLTKLLLRFTDINNGQILIDGQDIRSITQENLRRNIAYVPQEPLLFHRTIKENISYGRSKASDDEIKLAAGRAHAGEFIEKLPHGYGTLVGERGVKLSGGQRQRVAIARAMLKDAPILVLDEATSALDSESERLIQDALWQLMQDRTAIVIAHRLSTIQKMDRIVVLEDGEIVEQGTHTDLLAKNGIYAKLWSHQSGGFFED